MSLLPILTDEIKTRALYWAVEEKGGAGGFREWRKKDREELWEEDGAEPCGLEKPQAARDLRAGKQISVVVDLPNLGVQLINITELCGFYMVSMGLEIYYNEEW